VKSYEAICVFQSDLGEERINAIISKIEGKIKSSKGEIVKIDKWGIRRLLVSPKRTKKHKDGYYVAVYFKGEPAVPAAIRNLIGVTEGVLRHMIAVSKGGGLEEFAGAPAEERVEIAPSMLERPQG
jgi:small subunit ribosomal protein S6